MAPHTPQRSERRGEPVALLDYWLAAGQTEIETLRHHAQPLRPALPSVAVLPFADVSAARDQGHFCDSLAEELIGATA